MDTIPCKGCGTLLNLSDPGCPICLRGRSKYEITRAYADLREDKSRRRRRPFIVAGVLMAVGAVGRLTYLHRARIAQASDSVHAWATRFLGEASTPARDVPSPPAKNDAPPPPPAPLAADASRPAPPRAVSRPTAAPAATENVPDLIVPPLNPERWAVYGRVYDLKTLQPVGNVTIDFIHSAADHRAGNVSDENGRYLVILPRSGSPGGYEAVCGDARYLSPVFCEADVPYASLSSEDRALLIDSARSGDMHSTPLVDIAGEDSRHLDLFLAPRR